MVKLTDRPDMALDVYRGRKNNNITTATTKVDLANNYVKLMKANH